MFNSPVSSSVISITIIHLNSYKFNEKQLRKVFSSSTNFNISSSSICSSTSKSSILIGPWITCVKLFFIEWWRRYTTEQLSFASVKTTWLYYTSIKAFKYLTRFLMGFLKLEENIVPFYLSVCCTQLICHLLLFITRLTYLIYKQLLQVWKKPCGFTLVKSTIVDNVRMADRGTQFSTSWFKT